MKKIKVDGKRYQNKVSRVVDEAFIYGARAWHQTAIASSSRYTGQTHNAINAVAKAFGFRLAAVSPIDRKAAKLAKTARYSKSISGITRKRGNQYYRSFTFNSEVPQIWFNEYTRGLPSPPMRKRQPWRAMEKANKAFKIAAVSHVVNNLPELKDFIQIETIKLGG